MTQRKHGVADNLLSLAQAVKETDEALGTLYRLIREGSLKAVKVGKLTLVERAELDRFIADREKAKAKKQAAAEDGRGA